MKRYAQITDFLNNSSFFYAIAIGMDGKYIYVNPHYDRNFNFEGPTLRGKHFSSTLHPDDIRICEHVGQLCFSNPQSLFSATLRKHDGIGGYITTQWEMQGMLDAAGNPQSIFCVGYNITEFLDTRDRLAKASVQLDEISFVQSHGVRKPLANIMAISKLLEEAEDLSEIRLLSTMLHNSALEFDGIIKDISNKK